MKRNFVLGTVSSMTLSAVGWTLSPQGQPARGPVELRVDNLKTPLGIDDLAPRFSWQPGDSAQGARQTAYELMVASTPGALAQGKADVWTSGRLDSQ